MFWNGHIETIYPALFRRIPGMKPEMERIDTPDGDFLDLDWFRNNKERLVIICHGLEGNSRKPYMLGMARAVQAHLQTDVITWNYRGCSQEMNRQNRFYHSGATDDLDLVVNHALSKGYRSMAIIGFSLGGNLTLKYIGEKGDQLSSKIRGAVVFSVPLDLEGSSLKMKQWQNFPYSQRFLRTLKKKVRQKRSLRTLDLPFQELKRIRNLYEFDDLFTGPIHGFKDAKDYYYSCSSLFFLDFIEIPTLIVNAINDPFLSPSCFPKLKLSENKIISFEAPRHGGHCGFSDFKNEMYWSEERTLQFLKPLF